MFTIGYEGSKALVDGKARAKYGKLDTMALAREGLYRAAFASSLFSRDDADFQPFAAYFNEKAGTSLDTIDAFKRLFGVQAEDVAKVLTL
ncbi:MAG: hypothetical protein E4H20_01575 [Spirochaetales bacterium]|nr:MAG: hypothetical protein E4H20_01575 [Spirochaetales bacterium]